MKTHIMKILTVVAVTLGITFNAFATGPTIDSLTLQGYAKVTGGAALDAADYRIFVGLTNNNGTSYYWVKEFTSQTISNGLFSLVLTGAGQDLSGGTYTGLSPALPTGMAVDSSTGGTLITKFAAATSGTVKAKVVIYSGTNVGSPAVFTITLNSVPSAMVAGGVLDGTITTSSFLAGESVNSSAGVGSAGKIVLLNASGVLADSMFPATLPVLNGSNLTNVAAVTATTATTANAVAAGAVGLAGIAAAAKTNTSAGAGDAGKLVLLDGGGLLAGTLFPTALPAVDGSALTNVAAASATTASGVSAGAIDATALAANAVTSAKINDGTIAAADFAAGAVDATALGADAVTTAKILDGTIDAADFAAGAVDTTALAASAVSTAKIAASAVDLTTKVTGVLPLANGGTNGNITAVNGGAVYSTGSALDVTAAGTSGQVLTSSGAGAPTWATPSLPSSRVGINLWEDFLAVNLPAITAATNTLLGKAFLTNAIVAGGSTSMVTSASSHTGVFRFNTGTTTNQGVGVGFCGSSTGGTIVPSMRFEATTSDSWTFETSYSPTTVAANTGSYWIGVMSGSPNAITTMTGTLTGAFFQLLNAAPTTLTPYARKTTLYTGTNTTVAAGTYYNLKIVYVGGSPGTITFYVNGASVGSTSTATEIADATALCPVIYKKSNTVAGGIDIDYLGWMQTTTTGTGSR